MPTLGPIARFYSSTAGENALQADITNVQTAFSLASPPTGFPTSYPFTIAVGFGTTNEELMDVTSVAGPSLVVIRGVDGTSQLSHSAGEKVRHIASARDFREAQEHISTIAGGHGITGAFVGTTDAQTLTNKTLTAPVIGDHSASQHDHSPSAGGGNIPQSSVTNLVSDLAAKSPTGHSHVQSDVSGLVSAINSLTAADVAFDTRIDTLEATDITLDARLDVLEAASIFVLKTANESVTSSTTVQNDDHLFAAVPVSSTYEVSGVLITDGASPGDIKIAFTGPAGAEINMQIVGPSLTAGGGTDVQSFLYETLASSASFGTLGAADHRPIGFHGILKTAGTSGNFRLQWAQDTSNGTATRVLTNSYLALVKKA